MSIPSETHSGGKARYVMVGGFLGAGKTTAVSKLARRWADRGQKVGLITNDQGSELVDTRMLRAHGFATEEIPGGCFCCRFNSLVEAANNLSRTARPDVFIAEPVGSCTDLVATVSYPLRRMYGDAYVIAPLTVLVDPFRARRVLGLDRGGNFSARVNYIYRKQLEEADIIAINKSDSIDAARLESLKEALGREFPSAEVTVISARTGAGLDPWFERLDTGVQGRRASMEVDYDLYAEGEALLGWFNATVRVSGRESFSADSLIEGLAKDLQQRLGARGAEIAHLKMTFSPDAGFGGDLASVNLVRNDFVPELSMRLGEPVAAGQLVINLRAELAPEDLKAGVEEAIRETSRATPGLSMDVVHQEAFRPGRPTPVYRDA
jgi:Ni2+-binding GTPase involved in maturation of urease and hydrogenase